MSPMNLAGVLPWTYWRGLMVVGLLAIGNAVCMVCPFMLPRALAKRLLPARRAWPRWMRGKWLALALIVAYLCAYEAFDLWDDPRATAAIALSYFGAAFAVDAVFRGAAFCKHVCPIGQFQFVSRRFRRSRSDRGAPTSAARASRPTACAATTVTAAASSSCSSRRSAATSTAPSAWTACAPARTTASACSPAPAAELAVDAPRSSLRRLSERPDVAAVALVCVFGAFANAAGMLEPVLRRRARSPPASASHRRWR